MTNFKSIWTSISGSLSSAAPLLFACCKSGACVGVCASPVASLFGVSAAGFASTPYMDAAVPLLIALSAVSFTASYYKLYVLPKLAAACNTDSGCAAGKAGLKERLSKGIFWAGLVASIGFFTFFEYQKFQANNSYNANSTCNVTGEGKCETETAVFASFGNTDEKPCCSEEKPVIYREVKVPGVNNTVLMPVEETLEEKPCCANPPSACKK